MRSRDLEGCGEPDLRGPALQVSHRDGGLLQPRLGTDSEAALELPGARTTLKTSSGGREGWRAGEPGFWTGTA